MRSTTQIKRSSSTARPGQGKCFFKGGFIQPKLKVNQPDDSYEQEADTIADQIMHEPVLGNGSAFFKPKPTGLTSVQKKGTKAAGVPVNTNSVQQTLNSTGQPLDHTTRSLMENRFGHDFGKVQIHNDSLAHRSTAAIDKRPKCFDVVLPFKRSYREVGNN